MMARYKFSEESDREESPSAALPPDSSSDIDRPNGDDDKNTRMWTVLGSLGAPLGRIPAPLIVWLIKKIQYPPVDRQGKKSLNFQIAVMTAVFCCIPLVFVFIGVVLLPAVLVANLVLVIMVAVKTSSGAPCEYPMTIRFTK